MPDASHPRSVWRSFAASHLAACGAVTLLVWIYYRRIVFTGWVPHDEGALAQSAVRFNAGQIPHRDFSELYTGALTMIHAGAFRLLGTNLISLRLVLLGTVVASLPVVYYIAARFTRPWPAALIAGVAFLWSFPSYTASLPSWYNLVLALCGCAALLRFIEIGRVRWLFLAGIVGGSSILFKIVGVYLVAAATTAVLFYLATAPTVPRTNNGLSRAAWLATAWVSSVSLSFAPFLIMHAGMDAFELAALALPSAAPGIAITFIVIQSDRQFAPTLATLLLTLGSFVTGVMSPIAAYLVLYWHWGGLRALWDGVFVLSQRRIAWASLAGPTPWMMLLAVPAIYVLMSRRWGEEAVGLRRIAVAAVALCAVATAALLNPSLYRFVWDSARMAAAPISVASIILVVARLRLSGFRSTIAERRLLTVSVTASWIALTQYPFAAPVYFAYTSALAILAAVALVAVRATLATPLRAELLLATLFLGLTSRRFVFHYEMPRAAIYGERLATLVPGRGGIQVRASDSAVYAQVDSLVNAHSRTRAILAGPDSPEVSFLVGRENPTRVLFDFFEDSAPRLSQMRRAIESGTVDMIVLNQRAEFSGAPMPAFIDEVDRLFPIADHVGRFDVRWRAP